MKTFRGIGLGAVATVLSAGLWLGCSSDDTKSSGTPADGGGSDSTVVEGGSRETGTPADTGTVEAAVDAGTVVPEAGTSETGTTEAGAGDASDETTIATDAAVEAGDGAVEAAAAPTCAAYCTLIQTNCTGANMQYGSMPECMNACALTPVGVTGQTSGDTLACRTYHAGAPSVAMPALHCFHAGPYGFGGCGDECASFCRLAVGYCSPSGGFDAGAPPYASLAECTTACAGFARVAGNDGGAFVVDGGVDGGGGYNSAGPTAGNTLDCREYHLGVALGGGAAQVMHCPHPAAVSATCHL